jgi:hypothetical protein
MPFSNSGSRCQALRDHPCRSHCRFLGAQRLRRIVDKNGLVEGVGLETNILHVNKRSYTYAGKVERSSTELLFGTQVAASSCETSGGMGRDDAFERLLPQPVEKKPPK